MKLDKETEKWFLEKLAEGIAYSDSKTSKYMNNICKAYLESINKPVETTNEQPQILLKIICKNPKGCTCDTWAYIKDCEHSVEEISDSSNLWMIDGGDKEG